MAQKHTITGIDIGNSQIKVVVAKVEGDDVRPEIIGVGCHSSTSGLRNGAIVDMKETVENVRKAVAEAETMSGVKIRRAYVGVSGTQIGLQVSHGVVAVGRADGEIMSSDVERVLRAASVVSLPQNREVIFTKPRQFVIDGQQVVKDPVGMRGVRLEADVLIIDGPSQHLKYIAKCVAECGVEIAEFVYSPLAASLAALDKHQKEYGVMNLDFGGGTSAITVFAEADLVHSAVVPIGSRHITHDLAILLRTSIENAERIKLELGSTSDTVDMHTKEKVDLAPYMDGEAISMSRNQLVKVVDARVDELMEKVEEELAKAKKDGNLPAGIVLSGGGSGLPGFATMVRQRLGLPVRMAKHLNIDTLMEKPLDPAYSVAVGLVVWGFNREYADGARSFSDSAARVGGVWQSIVKLFKSFVP